MTQIKIQGFCHGDPGGFPVGPKNKGRPNGGCVVRSVAPKLRLRGLALIYLTEE